MDGKILVALCCLLVAAGPACVSQKKYLELESNLELTRLQFERQTQARDLSESARVAAEKRNQKLLAEMAVLNGHYMAMIEKNQALEAEKKALKEGGRVLQQKINGMQAALDKQVSIASLQEKVINETETTRKAIEARLGQQIASQEIQIREMAGKLKVTFVDRILFDAGRADISDRGKDLLLEIAATLLDGQNGTIMVEGHTDDRAIGSGLRRRFPTNWELSTARATAVVRFLQEAGGIAPERLAACGYSYYRPLAPNDTPEGRSRNRRIEIVLMPPP